MSTRCNIVVEDKYNSIQLYRHSDGYPDGQYGIVVELRKALKFAWELPRMEVSDFAAAIVRAWKEHGGNIYIDGEYKAKGENSLHGDIEYFYMIRPDEAAGRWSVSVWETKIHLTGQATLKKHLWTGHIGDTY